MSSAMIAVCFVYLIKLCCGQMFNMDLIEPPENPGPGMMYQKAPTFQMPSDYNINMNRNKNTYRTFNKDDEPDLSDLDTTLTKLEKWDEFEEIAEDIQKKNRGKKHVNFEEDVRDLSKWLKNLKEGNVQKEAMRTNFLSHPFQNPIKSWKQDPNPSPGMNMYWPEQPVKNESPVFPNQETNDKKAGGKIPVSDVMNKARTKMREAQLRMATGPLNQPKPKKSEEKTYVAAADDGIGPHARRRKGSRSYRKSSLSQERHTDAIPYFREETAPRMGSNNPKDQLREFPQMGGFPKSTAYRAPSRVPQPGSFPQMGGAAPMPRGPYPEMGSNGPMAFLHQGAIPQRPSPTFNGPMSAPQPGVYPQMGNGGPMPYPQEGDYSQQGDYPPMGAMDYMQSPYSGMGDKSAESAQRPLPDVMPQMGGNGPMPFPQPRPAPQMAGNGPTSLSQPGVAYQMGGNGPMPFPQSRPAPQMAGNGPMSLFQPGAAYQMGANGPMPIPQSRPAPQMTGNGPTQLYQPQIGRTGPMPFLQEGANPYTDALARGPSQPDQQWVSSEVDRNDPMPAPDKDPQKELDNYNTIKLGPPPEMYEYAPRATPEPYRMLPDKDDFNTPIKWVPMSSAKVEDGIAKVTDMDTGRNFNVVVNGTIYVPVIDDSLVPTIAPPTTVVPRTTTDNTAMKALLQFVTPEELTRNDWLGFDAALNRGEAQQVCDGGGCQGRCYTQSCQSTCHGDTCSAGCIGLRCTSSCDGPGCLSMCIGDECKAKCNGQACDARCKGTECKTDCKSFSCSHVANGKVKIGGSTWDQHYPDQGPDQYADGPQNVKPPTDQLRMGPMYEEDYNIDKTRSIEE